MHLNQPLLESNGNLDELEHVHLVDQTIFVCLLVTMILTLDKLLRNHLVDGAVKNDKNNIDMFFLFGARLFITCIKTHTREGECF